MKTKILSIIFFLCINCITISTIKAQEPNKKEMKPYEIKIKNNKKIAKNLQDVFKSMFENAILTAFKNNGTCKSEDLVGLANPSTYVPGNNNTTAVIGEVREIYFENIFETGLSDVGKFNSIEDRDINAFTTTDTFSAYVKSLTGKDIGEVTEVDERGVKIIDGIRKHYNFLKINYDRTFILEVDEHMGFNCTFSKSSILKIKSFDYPNAIWEIRTLIKVDCDCSIEAKTTEVKGGVFEYTSETTGLLSSSTITFGAPKNSKIKVISLTCCPEKEENKTALKNDADNDKGGFQVSLNGGIPLGKEKDFYSLVYGAEAAYLFNISDNFSAGAGAGYTHFTGKEGIDGIGFVPIFSKLKFDFTDKFAVRTYVGYAISTETNGKGGLYYSAGLEWKPTPNISIGPAYSSINLDGGSFNWVSMVFSWIFITPF